MRIYVESNFLLEIVWEQAQEDSARRLLELAGGGSIELVVPSFALIEPYWTLRHRSGARQHHLEQLGNTKRALIRSRAGTDAAATVDRLIEQIGRLDVADDASYKDVVKEIFRVCRTVDLRSDEIVKGSSIMVQTGIGYFDAVLLATVLADLRAHPPIKECAFVSLDRRGFSDPTIQALLADLGCKYIGSFEDAVAFVTAVAQR